MSNANDDLREKIADWYGAYYDPRTDRFLERNDVGVQPDEDEAAMHAYRGAKWALEWQVERQGVEQ